MLSIGLPTLAAAQVRGRAQVQVHSRFDDHDRQVVTTWYDGHHTNLPRGMRDNDRFPPNIEGQIQAGYVLDPGMRRQVNSVPAQLLRMLGPAPRGDRYVMINGHILLIDRRYQVIDVIHVGHGR